MSALIGWIPDETPILESVFSDVAPNASDITDVFANGLPSWAGVPLSYYELLETVTDEEIF